MKTHYGRFRHRSTGELLIAGMGTLTFDQSIRCPKTKSAREALAGDWIAVGDDLRWAMKHVVDSDEAA